MDEPARLASSKRLLRARQRTLREGLDPALGVRLVPHLAPLFRPGLVVSGFWPMGHEIDVRPVLDAARDAACVVVLPVTVRRGEALVFRRFDGPAVLVPGPFGTSEPGPLQPSLDPGLVLVPLLAFDGRGGRLGYGGGFYDRTLAWLRGLDPNVRAIGCAYAAQAVDEVPMEPFDQRLDGVATEDGLRWFEGVTTGR